MRRLDLAGEDCPYTFVRTKLALEEMEDGEVLRVLLDSPSAVRNVPRSAVAEGHEVLSVEALGGGRHEVHIRKASRHTPVPGTDPHREKP